MANPFSDDVVAAVRHHMNDDHADDNLLIARAFGGDDITGSTFVDFDENAARWQVQRGNAEPELLAVGWPDAPISERAEVRRQVVVIYTMACEKLGVKPRSH
ncbi:DUF2470 domain-containing protein [Microbacterium sp. YY-01]|uniref:DUF2470 domain-containing protein n=1 Tax=Microbacterium sp. YY-01 TaxID=3421634 RepID=UPI003D18450A